jgi:hypothetical protein
MHPLSPFLASFRSNDPVGPTRRSSASDERNETARAVASFSALRYSTVSAPTSAAVAMPRPIRGKAVLTIPARIAAPSGSSDPTVRLHAEHTARSSAWVSQCCQAPRPETGIDVRCSARFRHAVVAGGSGEARGCCRDRTRPVPPRRPGATRQRASTRPPDQAHIRTSYETVT